MVMVDGKVSSRCLLMRSCLPLMESSGSLVRPRCKRHVLLNVDIAGVFSTGGRQLKLFVCRRPGRFFNAIGIRRDARDKLFTLWGRNRTSVSTEFSGGRLRSVSRIVRTSPF